MYIVTQVVIVIKGSFKKFYNRNLRTVNVFTLKVENFSNIITMIDSGKS